MIQRHGERFVNRVFIDGEVKRIADELGIEHISVSSTHTANFAIASAVALTI